MACAQVAIAVVQGELESPMHNELSQADQKMLQELNRAVTEGKAAIGSLAAERAQVGSVLCSPNIRHTFVRIVFSSSGNTARLTCRSWRRK